MDRLRPRERQVVSGFTKPEIDKMEKLLKDSVERLLDPENCRRITKSFNRSSGRAGKPVIKWTEVQTWFQMRLQEYPSTSTNMSENGSFLPESSPSERVHTDSQMPKGGNIPALSDLEFEAKSSKDGAWYDIEMFLAHRTIDPDETEVCVRYVGFGAEEDEWVNVKNAVRLRSIPIEHSECPKVKVGETVLCLQERRDQSLYYDAQVVDIQRKMHDVRGCRCIFFVRYMHDGTQEKVRLRRLCFLANF